jgi:hypothetical protein
MNYQTFRAMQSGAKAMQQARGQLDVDDVDQVLTPLQLMCSQAAVVRINSTAWTVGCIASVLCNA